MVWRFCPGTSDSFVLCCPARAYLPFNSLCPACAGPRQAMDHETERREAGDSYLETVLGLVGIVSLDPKGVVPFGRDIRRTEMEAFEDTWTPCLTRGASWCYLPHQP